MQSTFSHLEMHSKRRYKFCTCSVILGELECLRNFKDLVSFIFSIIFDAINVSFFQPKNSLTWGVKCEKLNLRKS